MLNIDAPSTRAALPFDTLIDALRDMFVEGCEVPLRHNHAVEAAGGVRGTLLLMPAWSAASGYLGVKTVSIYPQNGTKGKPGLFSTYILYDAGTGEPLALIDGNEITSRRTAAASALAARFLARKDASTMLLLGSGRVASLIPAAYRSVHSIRKVKVWDIVPASAARLVETLLADGIEAETVEALDSDAFDVDIVSAATLSTAPLILRRFLRPGTHVDLIGGFTPEMRESDDGCFADTAVFVDTAEAAMKAGDLLSPIRGGVFAADRIRGDLTGLCRGEVAGRTTNEEITVFKAVGTALEDLAAAALCYRSVSQR